MSANVSISRQGDNPVLAADRLGLLIDNMTLAVPEAVMLVARIIPTNQDGWESSADQEVRTAIYQSLIPEVVATRARRGQKILTVDFSRFPRAALNMGGVHLTDAGYDLMGRWWYDFIHQIPSDWIGQPVGPNPLRVSCKLVFFSSFSLFVCSELTCVERDRPKLFSNAPTVKIEIWTFVLIMVSVVAWNVV